MERYWYIGLVALCLVACGPKEKSSKEQPPIKVKTMVVASRAGGATTRYVGTIEPVHETPLSMQASGRVVAVCVKNGDKVRKGQVLVEIDKTQALNALKGAEASLKHAEDGYTRAKQVHDKGVITDQKMVEIESQLTQARSLYQAAKQQYDECSLTAPYDGVVNGLDLTSGQTVIPGTKVCAILDISAFSVRFTVPEGEINAFKETNGKLTGEVECAAVNSVFPITISEKSVTANPVTHTFDVVAHIKGGADVLMTGMVGVVKVKGEKISTEEENIIIPARCILLKPEGHTVWLMENGKAVRRDISIDGYQADGVRVLNGLQAGDTLITDGYQKLYNQCKVICENE